MTAFLIYILKSALILAVLVSLFMLFMSRETFHRINRYLMLSIISLAFLLPAVNIGIESPFCGLIDFFSAESSADALPVPPTGEYIIGFEEPAAGVALPDAAPLQEPFDWLSLVSLLYLCGVAFLVLRQIVVYVQVARVISRSRVVDASSYGCKGIRLCVHNGKAKPFSWFHWVVVSEEDLNDGAHEILTHEAAHTHARHSLDIMIADAVIIMQWFNPLAWIMKSTLKDIHEFEADEAVINSGVDAKQYQLLIIKKAVGARLYSIANSFNHSLTKKRITMMCKEKSKKWSCTKALYIVPVAAVAALAFSTVDTASATDGETLLKGSEIIANEANEAQENYVNAEFAADDEKVYQVCENAPEFPGGMDAMMRYLSTNIKYPAEAKAAGKEGRSIVKFIVKKDGSIANVEIVKSSGDKSLDDEALRVVSSMPKWKPGTQGGKPVNVQFMLPVAFMQQNNNKASLIELKGGDIAMPANSNAAVVVNGSLYNESELPNIDSGMVESVTVVKIEKLSADDIKKYKAEGKSGVIFIQLKKDGASPVADDGAVYQVCEEQPAFPGGVNELMTWLSRNIKYPKEARDINAQGKVYVRFVVKADGSIDDVNVIKSETYSSYVNKLDEVIVLSYENSNAEPLTEEQKIELHNKAKKALADESVRVVKSMPKWTPGMQSGKPVNVQFTMPVNFRLQ